MSKLLEIYLYTALLFGIIGLIDSIIAPLFQLPIIYFNILSTLLFIFFIFNIIALVLFFNKKLAKKFLILPTYHLLMFILSLTLSWLVGSNILFSLSIIIGIFTSLFETVFSIYLLTNLNKN